MKKITDIRIENSDLIITEQEQVAGPKEIKNGDIFEAEHTIHIIPLNPDDEAPTVREK